LFSIDLFKVIHQLFYLFLYQNRISLLTNIIRFPIFVTKFNAQKIDIFLIFQIQHKKESFVSTGRTNYSLNRSTKRNSLEKEVLFCFFTANLRHHNKLHNNKIYSLLGWQNG